MSSGGGGFNPAQPIQQGLGNVTGAHGIGGIMSNLTGQAQVADAYGQAAGQQLAQQQNDRSQAMGLMMPTAAEIQQLQQAMDVNQQSIKQSQDLINSTDPALQAAGQQALELMQGKSAASLAPLSNQRTQQKEQLKSQLEQQLGSGYATSSAGIQALNNFDQQTSNLTNQAQQGAIGQYMGYAGMGAQLGASQQQQGFQNYLAGNNQSYGWRQGQAGALMGTPINPGLQYAGDIARAQAGSNFGLGGMISLVGSTGNAVKQWTGKDGAAGGMSPSAGG